MTKQPKETHSTDDPGPQNRVLKFLKHASIRAVLPYAVVVLLLILSRKILRARIQRTLAAKPSLFAIQRAVIHDEFRLQALIRLTPLNPATITYLLGAAGVRFFGFITACLALIPNLFIEVYFGHVGKHATRMAASADRASHLHEFVVIVGLMVCIVVMVYISRTARKAIAQAVADSQTVNTQTDGKFA